MLKSISNTSLQEMQLQEKLLNSKNNTKNNQTENANDVKMTTCMKTPIFIFSISILLGFLIFIIISYNK
jgi:hypothetical protein